MGTIQTVTPASGPIAGGNRITIGGIGLGSGSDITAVTVDGPAYFATIVSQTGTQVVVTAPSWSGTTGTGTIVVSSTSRGSCSQASAYLYNPCMFLPASVR